MSIEIEKVNLNKCYIISNKECIGRLQRYSFDDVWKFRPWTSVYSMEEVFFIAEKMRELNGDNT